jgi:hypothetical protein
MSDVIELTADIEVWAKALDCHTAFVTGRRGWSKVLPNHGWRVEPTVNFRKEL